MEESRKTKIKKKLMQWIKSIKGNYINNSKWFRWTLFAACIGGFVATILFSDKENIYDVLLYTNGIMWVILFILPFIFSDDTIRINLAKRIIFIICCVISISFWTAAYQKTFSYFWSIVMTIMTIVCFFILSYILYYLVFSLSKKYKESHRENPTKKDKGKHILSILSYLTTIITTILGFILAIIKVTEQILPFLFPD